ncbi:MAG: rRNA maturation RNase YbeY [Pseudomonadota bacterium]
MGTAASSPAAAGRLLRLSLQFARTPAVRPHRDHLPRPQVMRWLRAALSGPAEITVRIVGEAEALALNRDYRGQDHATNVLTFDYETTPVVVADLVLCAEVVEREALAQGITLEAHYAHLLVHGALHAQGHDHQTEAEAAVMEALESELLQSLGFADPYGHAG